MPILSISSTRDNVFAKIYDYLKVLVQQVIVPHFEDDKSPKRTPSDIKEATIQGHSHKDYSATKESEPTDVCQLFPSQNNNQLSLRSKSSVVPCALNFESLQTPFSIDIDENGTVSTQLNLGGTMPQDPVNDDLTKPHSDLLSSPLLDESYMNNEQYKALFPSSFLPITPISNVITPASKKSVDDSPLSDSVQGATDESSETLPYICHYCDSRFRIRGYLTRHIKKHAKRKAYHCPFFDGSISQELRCHNSGGFSRRDTYKTHLKSRHFNYPEGIKPQYRNKSSGACAQCGEFFSSSENWVESHIEAGSCKGLPEGYSERIREKKKTSKMKMIKTLDGQTRFISSEESILEPRGLLDGNSTAAAVINAKQSHRDNILPTNTGGSEIVTDTQWFEHKRNPKPSQVSRKLQSQVTTDIQNSKNASIISPPIMSPQDTSLVGQEYHSSKYTLHMDSPAVSSVSSALSPLSGDPIASAESDKLYPLDSEQSFLEPNGMDEHTIGHLQKSNMISINEILEKQMNFELLGRNHLKETQDYLALYKKASGAEF